MMNFVRISNRTQVRSCFLNLNHLRSCGGVNSLLKSNFSSLTSHHEQSFSERTLFRLNSGSAAAKSWATVPARHLAFSNVLFNVNTPNQLFVLDSDTKANFLQDLVPIEKVTAPVSELTSTILTASDIGLSNYLPPRLVFDALNYLHDHLDLTWCGSIALITLAARIFVFPFMIKMRKQTVHLANVMPEVQQCERNFNQAIEKKDYDAALKHQQEFMENSIKLRKRLPALLLLPWVQATIFSSFFFCIRAMADHPVPSLKDESFLWINSLSETDPYFLLPFATAFSMYIIFRLGVEYSNQLNSSFMKYAPFVLAPMTFAFTCFFPSALVLCWFVNNQISILQSIILLNPSVQNYLQMPKVNVPKVNQFEQLKFQEGLKSSWESAKIAQNLEERKQLDEKQTKK